MLSLNTEVAVQTTLQEDITSESQEEFSIVDEQDAFLIDADAADIIDAECSFDNQLSAETLVDDESYDDLSQNVDLQKLTSTCKY